MTDKSDYEASLEASIAKLVAALERITDQAGSLEGPPNGRGVLISWESLIAAREAVEDQEGCQP